MYMKYLAAVEYMIKVENKLQLERLEVTFPLAPNTRQHSLPIRRKPPTSCLA